MVERRDWTRAELLVCLAVYATLPSSERRVPPKRVLEHLAAVTGRTPGSISLRFANFNSEDPLFTSKGLSGMKGGGAHVHHIWTDFSNNEGELQLATIVRELVNLVPIDLDKK